MKRMTESQIYKGERRKTRTALSHQKRNPYNFGAPGILLSYILRCGTRISPSLTGRTNVQDNNNAFPKPPVILRFHTTTSSMLEFPNLAQKASPFNDSANYHCGTMVRSESIQRVLYKNANPKFSSRVLERESAGGESVDARAPDLSI